MPYREPGSPPAIIHLVDANRATVSPLCGDWRYATNWTTVAAVVTCTECLAKLAAPQPASEPAIGTRRP